MLKMNTSKIGRELRLKLARLLLLLLLVGSLVAVPMGLPGTSNTAEAGCFLLANSQCELASSIEVTWLGVTLDGYFVYNVHPTNTDLTLWNGICGLGMIEPSLVDPCGILEVVNKRNFKVGICPQFIDISSRVDYVIRNYVGDENTPRKWPGSIFITPSNFGEVGQTITLPC
jgi:hypothetical protein